MAKTKQQDEALLKGKLEAMEKAVAALEKDYGKGTIIGANEKPKYHQCISTGSIGLDKALGIGGLPKGRIVEVYGPESSGKTTLALHVIAEAHAKDPTSYCAFIDVEHAIDTLYAENLGVDLNRLQISQPDNGEQALEIARRLSESGAYDIIVIDSVAALVPKAELEGEVGDAAMGKQARMMSQALRMLTGVVSKSGTILLFTNQLRDKIGVMFGSPETTTGGNALKFYASIRIDIRRSFAQGTEIKNADEERIGNKTVLKVVKNKLSPPFRKCDVNIIYGIGIDKVGEVLDMAVEVGVVNKSGSWYSYKSDKLGQGVKSVCDLLRENTELYEEIKLKTQDSFTPKEFIPTQKEVEDGE